MVRVGWRSPRVEWKTPKVSWRFWNLKFLPASCAAILPSAVKTAKAWLRKLVVHQTGLFDGDITKTNWDSNIGNRCYQNMVQIFQICLGKFGNTWLCSHFGTSTKHLEIGPPRVDQPIKCGNALQCPSSNWKYSFGRTDKFNLVFLEPSWTPRIRPNKRLKKRKRNPKWRGKKNRIFNVPESENAEPPERSEPSRCRTFLFLCPGGDVWRVKQRRAAATAVVWRPTISPFFAPWAAWLLPQTWTETPAERLESGTLSRNMWPKGQQMGPQKAGHFQYLIIYSIYVCIYIYVGLYGCMHINKSNYPKIGADHSWPIPYLHVSWLITNVSKWTKCLLCQCAAFLARLLPWTWFISQFVGTSRVFSHL